MRMMVSSLDIYTEHFALRERPFSLVPDPDFMFWSPVHRWTYTMLEYGLLTKAPITLKGKIPRPLYLCFHGDRFP